MIACPMVGDCPNDLSMLSTQAWLSSQSLSGPQGSFCVWLSEFEKCWSSRFFEGRLLPLELLSDQAKPKSKPHSHVCL